MKKKHKENCDSCAPLCTVDRVVGGGDVVFVTPDSEAYTCRYLLHFGDSLVCTCPLRRMYCKQ